MLWMCGIADPVYPPSLYRAVSYASTLGVPVYILENGMPAAKDDERRTEWIDGCLAEVPILSCWEQSKLGLALQQKLSHCIPSAELVGRVCACYSGMVRSSLCEG